MKPKICIIGIVFISAGVISCIQTDGSDPENYFYEKSLKPSDAQLDSVNFYPCYNVDLVYSLDGRSHTTSQNTCYYDVTLPRVVSVDTVEEIGSYYIHHSHAVIGWERPTLDETWEHSVEFFGVKPESHVWGNNNLTLYFSDKMEVPNASPIGIFNDDGYLRLSFTRKPTFQPL